MSDPTPSDRDDALGRLTEELTRILADGSEPDPARLARRFGLEIEDVERCWLALEAVGDAIAEPVPTTGAGEGDLPPPVLPEDYELLGEIGRGGMAVVYRARQKSLGRTVAIKVLRPGEIVFGEFQKRILREAKALARLRHPHIVNVHEVGEAGGNVFFSMDLVEGSSLADLIASGELTPTQAVKLLRQVASAVAYSHGQGLVHRDLKPANILIDRAGDAFVVDFGLARDLAVKGDLTETGQLLGTPYYMSPEQARGDTERIGEATDVYALGAVLYECLAGTPPFKGIGGLVETIQAVIHREPGSIRKTNPKVPRDLEVICRKAMAKEPGRRYATAQALLEDLERFAEGRPIRARPPSLGYRLARGAGRQRKAILAAAGGLALAAVVFLVFVLPRLGRDPETLARTAERLAASGRHAAAEAVYEEALRQGGWWRTPVRTDPDGRFGELPGELRLGWAESRLDVETTRAEAFRETLEALRTAFREDLPLPLHAEILWRIARAREPAEGDGPPKEIAAIEALIRDRKITLDAPEGPEIVDRLAPALNDPSDPGHELVAFLLEWDPRVTRRETSGEERPKAGSKLVRPGPEAVPKLIARLRRLTGSRTVLSTVDPEYGKLHDRLRVLALTQAQPLRAALAAAAGDAELSPMGRTVAAEMLCVVADLPHWIPSSGRWGDDDTLFEPDESYVRTVLEHWSKVRGLSRSEGLRERVACLMASLGRNGPDLSPEPAGAWLRRRGVDPNPGTFEGFRAWWTAHRDEPPETWLTRALGLETPAAELDVAEVFRMYEAAGGLGKPRLGQLLRLIVPEGTAVPSARQSDRVGGSYEVHRPPEGLADAWEDALRSLLPGPPGPAFRVRMAAIAFPDRGAAPVLLWEESRLLDVGESAPFRHLDRIPIPDAPVPETLPDEVHRVVFPGHPRRKKEAPPSEVHRDTLDLVSATTAHLEPWPDAVYLSLRPVFFRLSSGWHLKLDGGGGISGSGVLEGAASTRPITEGYVGIQLASAVCPVNASERAVVFGLFTCFERAETPDDPRGLDHWLGCLPRNLDRVAADVPGIAARPRVAATFDWSDRLDEIERAVWPHYESALRAWPLLRSAEARAALDRADEVVRRLVGEDMRMYVVSRWAKDEPERIRRLDRLLDGDLSDFPSRPIEPATPPLVARNRKFEEFNALLQVLPGTGVRRRVLERFLLSTDDPRVFAFAQRIMEFPSARRELPPHLAPDVARRCRALGLEVPASILERQASAEKVPWILGTLAGIGALALLALILAVRPGLRPEERGRPAALLLLLGAAIGANHLDVGGTDLRLEIVGPALMVLAAFLLAPASRGFARWLPPVCFAAAIVLVLILEGSGRSFKSPGNRLPWGLWIAATAVGFGSLPLMAWTLARCAGRGAGPVAGRFSRFRRLATEPAVLFAAGALGLVVTLVAKSAIRGPRSEVELEIAVAAVGDALTLVALLLLAIALPARAGREKRGPRYVRGLWDPRVLLLVLAFFALAAETGRVGLARAIIGEYGLWFHAPPSLWVAMLAAILSVIVAANRRAPGPSGLRRVLDRLRRRILTCETPVSPVSPGTGDSAP